MFDTTKTAKKTKAGPGQMTDAQLWQRIENAPLPVSPARHEFAETLAHLNDLPMYEAREVVQEYRRFLYLAAASDGRRVPPEPVRKAWELHARSPDYAAFCTEALGKPLGLDDGARKFGANAAYGRTLAAYARAFGTLPPAAIWPPAIQSRLPRWLLAHVAVLGLTGMMAIDRGEPSIFAIGVGLSLALYGLDLLADHLGRKRHGLGAAVSADLAYFLSEPGGR